MPRFTPILLLALAAVLTTAGCAIDQSSSVEAVSERQLARAVHGIPVAPVRHQGAGFAVQLPVGPMWSVVELNGRLLALELGVPTPVTVVVSARDQRPPAEVEARWRAAFADKGFRIVDRLEQAGVVVLLAEGDEAVSGRSLDTVVIRVLADGRTVQCSVGAPSTEARVWARAIREICDTVEPAPM